MPWAARSRKRSNYPACVFETGSAELMPESMPVLEGAISTLKRYPELNVEVAGHTDSRGSDASTSTCRRGAPRAVLKYLQATVA